MKNYVWQQSLCIKNQIKSKVFTLSNYTCEKLVFVRNKLRWYFVCERNISINHIQFIFMWNLLYLPIFHHSIAFIWVEKKNKHVIWYVYVRDLGWVAGCNIFSFHKHINFVSRWVNCSNVNKRQTFCIVK